MDQPCPRKSFFYFGRKDIAKRVKNNERTQDQIDRKKKIENDLPKKFHGSIMPQSTPPSKPRGFIPLEILLKILRRGATEKNDGKL